jgi:hypothetical protein
MFATATCRLVCPCSDSPVHITASVCMNLCVEPVSSSAELVAIHIDIHLHCSPGMWLDAREHVN